MGTQGSLEYYENRDPGPHFSMKMGTRGPHFGGPYFHMTPAVLQLISIHSCNKTFNVNARIPPTEKTPLIVQSEVPIEYSFKFRRMVQKVVYGLGLLEFRKENRESYVSHYSRGFLSHPLFVIVVIFIGFWLFVMACTSIAISPQKLTCDI